jgi:site-specific recombinase XerD
MAGPHLPDPPSPDVPSAVDRATEDARVRDFQRLALSPSTVRAYRSDVAIWAAWCAERGLDPLQAASEDLTRFLASQAEPGRRIAGDGAVPLKVATIRRRLAAIRKLYETAGLPSPTQNPSVALLMRGIARERGVPPERKDALEANAVKAMVSHVPRGQDGRPTLAGLRDRALILLGFAGAFRRAELVALDVGDLRFEPEGLLVLVRRSKTDAEGLGRTKAIHRGEQHCAVRALQDWIEASRIEQGPVFRWIRRGGHVTEVRLSPESVGRIVKRYSAQAGLLGDFSGHSLRAGFVTSARKNGAELEDVMSVSHHRAVQTVQAYFREADQFRADPLHGLL